MLDIAATYQNLADNYLEIKKLDSAFEYSQIAIKILRENLAKNPADSQTQGELGGTYITSAEIFVAKGDANSALETYRKALTILESDAIRNSQMRSLAYAYQGVGEIHQKANRFQEAKSWYQKSLDVWNGLREQEKLTSDNLTKPDEIKKLIENCEAKLK